MLFFAFVFYLSLLFLSALSPMAALILFVLSFMPAQRRWTRNALHSAFVGGLLGLAAGLVLMLFTHALETQTASNLLFASWLYFGGGFTVVAVISSGAHCYHMLFPWRRFHPPTH